MEEKELLEKLQSLTNKEISLSELSIALELSEYNILSLARTLKEQGINISTRQKDNDIYFFNQGEKNFEEDYSYNVKSEDSEFKFVAIADTRIGCKSQQLEVLNDIYDKAQSLGYHNVILCGNITNGLYPVTSKYANNNFLEDSLMQVDYIAENYPSRDGIKTYFVTGKKDDKHMKINKINIGKRIGELRKDMIYLGDGSCKFKIDKVNMLIFAQSLEKTYTVSYRPQQQIDSFRSEDKPDILLYSGLLEMQKFTYRGVSCISVPSVCSTNKEMSDKRYSNTVGAWYITITVNSKGQLKSVKAIDSVYYQTQKEYSEPKRLVKRREK